MKKVILFMAIATAVGFTSCTEESDLPSDNSSISDVTSNRGDVVGTNQTVEFSCPVYVSSEATNASIMWVNSWGISSESDSYTDGVAQKSYSFSSAKEATITCNATYLYGTESRTLTKNISFTVINSHFINSFIGDSFETVSSDNPIISATETTNVYSGGVDSDNTYYYYTFSDGNLLKGETMRTVTESLETHYPRVAYSRFGTYVSAYESSVGVSGLTVYNVYYHGYTPTASEAAIISDFIEDGVLAETDDRTVLGELVDQSLITLVATVTMDTTPTNGIVTTCELVHIAGTAEGTYLYVTTTEAI